MGSDSPKDKLIQAVPAQPPPLDLEPAYALIKDFEGCRLLAYLDPVGILTIGWGHTGSDVLWGQTISQEDADLLFEQDIGPLIVRLKIMITRDYSSNQFGALLSFAYNCGSGALSGSTLLRYFNEGRTQAAADQFLLWTHGTNGVELEGLIRRRNAERDLFLRA